MENWLSPLMFVVLLGLIFSGYPVAFAMAGTAMIFSIVGISLGFFDWNLLYAMFDRSYGIMSNGVLLAVPFFLFMGAMLEKSRLAEDLLKTIGQLLDPFEVVWVLPLFLLAHYWLPLLGLLLLQLLLWA